MKPIFRVSTFVLFIVLARPAFCQPLPDRAPIIGVVSTVKGDPIAGALLSLRRSESRSNVAFWGATAQSDAAGNFRFPDAEEGDYGMTVEAPGYATLPYFEISKWRAGNAILRVTLDRLIDFTLNLRAPDGSPVVNAPVFVRLRPADIDGQMMINARSNDKGEVLVPGIKPGNYSVYLRAPMGFAQIENFAVVEPATAPRDVALQAGGALKMTVNDSLGRALGGASLSLMPSSVAGASEAQKMRDVTEDFALLAASNNRGLLVSRDGDGTIALDGLPPGVYIPRLSLPGYDFADSQPITIAPNAPVELKVEAPSRRARTLNLQLRSPDGQPYTKGEVSLRVLPVAANGQLGGDPPPNPDDADDLPFFPSGPGGRRALPDDQGRVALFPVKAGHYRIFASPQIKEPGQIPPEATPVDVTITATGAMATVVVPG